MSKQYLPAPLNADGTPQEIYFSDPNTGVDTPSSWTTLCDEINASTQMTQQEKDDLIAQMSADGDMSWQNDHGLDFVISPADEPPTAFDLPAPVDEQGNHVSFSFKDATGNQVHGEDWHGTINHIKQYMTAAGKTEQEAEQLVVDLYNGNPTITLPNGITVNPTVPVKVPKPIDPKDYAAGITEAMHELRKGGQDDFGFDTESVQVKRTGRRGRRIKPSDTAFKLDSWSLRKGERLAQDKHYEQFVKAGLLDKHRLADLHAACFDPYLEMAELPKDVQSQKWFEGLLESPDFNALKNQTALDVLLSDIATVSISEQYVEYRKQAKKQEQSARDAARSAAKAAQNAKQQVDEACSVGGAFGLEMGQMTNQDPTEMLKLFRKIRENHQLKRICDLAGKYRMLAQAKQRVKDHYGLDEVVGIELDGDMSRLVGSELSMLNCGVEELELDTLRRITERQALCRQHSGFKHVARGPIMVLLDESGSMSGEPICQAKALSLALAWIAKAQGRWCSLVSWSSQGQYNFISLPPGQWDAEAVANWCCGFLSGGTHPPIENIQEIYDSTKAPDGKTDLIFISDGDAHVDERSAAVFNQWRHDHKAKSITLLVADYDQAFKLISDQVHKIKRIDLNEAAIGEVLSI